VCGSSRDAFSQHHALHEVAKVVEGADQVDVVPRVVDDALIAVDIT